MSRSLHRSLVGAAGVGLGIAALAVASPSADAAPVTETFAFTGAAEDFVVPAGVCEVAIEATGASGGEGALGDVGGLGGTAATTIEVTPGETLIVRVGGQGEP